MAACGQLKSASEKVRKSRVKQDKTAAADTPPPQQI
jgi:hypothetical protein